LRASRIEAPEQPRFADAATEDLLTGGRTLRRAFLQTPLRFAGRDTALIRLDEREPPVVLLRNGFAYKSCALADGRRAILDLLVPGDIIGLDHIILASPNEEVTAVNRIAYHAMEPAEMRALMADRCAALRIVALLAEARCRSDRLAAMIGRLDAQARLAAFLLGIHDRLRQRGLTNHLTFNLPLTQEQIADHLGLTLVHVNRTLRRMREERLVLVDRQLVIIRDLDGLRGLARGLPQPAEMPEPVMPPDTAGNDDILQLRKITRSDG
jgi:CRP/FNR family transcriptional regulator, anaerobic regulatory protein